MTYSNHTLRVSSPPPSSPTHTARLSDPSKRLDSHPISDQSTPCLNFSDGSSRTKTATQSALNNADVLNQVLEIARPRDFQQLRAVSRAFRDVFDSPLAWAKQYEPASIHRELRTIYTSSQAAWTPETKGAYQHKVLRKTYRNETWTIKQGPPPKTPTAAGDLKKLDRAWELNILQENFIFYARSMDPAEYRQEQDAQRAAVYCALLHRGYLRAHGQGPKYSIPPVSSFYCAAATGFLYLNYHLAPWLMHLSEETTSPSKKLVAPIVITLLTPIIVLNAMIAAGTFPYIVSSVPVYIQLNRLADTFYNAAVRLPHTAFLPQNAPDQNEDR